MVLNQYYIQCFTRFMKPLYPFNKFSNFINKCKKQFQTMIGKHCSSSVYHRHIVLSCIAILI